MEPELERVYTITETMKNWPDVFDRAFYFMFSIPTETVLRAPGLQIPDQGRAWATPWYIFANEPRTYDELREAVEKAGLEFNGCGYFPRVCIIEIWNDTGDDGHVRYDHHGYAFFAEEPDMRSILGNTDNCWKVIERVERKSWERRNS